MTDLSDSAEKHLDKVRELQEHLSREGAAVLEHHYILLLMGSFSVVVGTAHRRIKFDWDGREFFLNIQTCSSQSQSSAQEWTQEHNMRIAPPQSVWPAIIDRCTHAFGA